MHSFRFGPLFGALALTILTAVEPSQAGPTIRIVTYNIDCSDQGIVQPNAGFDTILHAIGNHHLAGNAQPLDVLVMQELDGFQAAPQGNSATLPYVVSELNAIYGMGVYALDPTADPTSGALTGNGPSGMVYNTHTIQVISAAPIGAAERERRPRQPMRYRLRPVGQTASADVYLYVSHYKAGSTSSDINRRNIEAQEIRSDADSLGATAHIIYAGDFNLTGGSAEAMYQTLIATGSGQAHDPAVNGAFSNTAAFVGIESESSTSLSARFDFQLVSGATLNQPGFQLVAGSYTVFGNNGTTPYNGTTNSANNTSLSDLANAAQVLSLLSTVSDHLPVVADYTVAGSCVQGPSITGQPSPQAVCAGVQVTFTVTASGSPAPGYQWRKNSVNIPGATAASYTLASPSASDAGSYDCVVSNLCSSATSNAATLAVTIAPSVTDTSPQTVAVKIGKSATLTASGSGTAPAYQWRRNSADLPEGGDYAGTATTSLTITPASRTDAGTYDVTASNGCGNATSVTATVLNVLCVADFNNSGTVTVQDIFSFLVAWFNRTPEGDFNGDMAVTVQDLFDFLVAFFSPCP